MFSSEFPFPMSYQSERTGLQEPGSIQSLRDASVWDSLVCHKGRQS